MLKSRLLNLFLKLLAGALLLSYIFLYSIESGTSNSGSQGYLNYVFVWSIIGSMVYAMILIIPFLINIMFVLRSTKTLPNVYEFLIPLMACIIFPFQGIVRYEGRESGYINLFVFLLSVFILLNISLNASLKRKEQARLISENCSFHFQLNIKIYTKVTKRQREVLKINLKAYFLT